MFLQLLTHLDWLDVQILIKLQFSKQYKIPLKTNGSEGVTPATTILKNFIRAIICQNTSKKKINFNLKTKSFLCMIYM